MVWIGKEDEDAPVLHTPRAKTVFHSGQRGCVRYRKDDAHEKHHAVPCGFKTFLKKQ